jgi:diguanylate cyclase (GGDEF)-like protein/PAS domain S-box-containing protein
LKIHSEIDEGPKKIRAQGFPNYTIRPDGVRSLYTSIIYLEPFDLRNQRAFGFDMFSEPKRRTAMERARDTGSASISAKVTLAQETSSAVQPGILMYLPKYKNGAPHNTAAERQANLQGYIYSPFRLNDLMRGILKTKQGSLEPDIDFEIYDSKTLSTESLLYDDDGIAQMLNPVLSKKLAFTQSIEIYGHTWYLYFIPRPAFYSTFDQAQPLKLLGLGSLLSLLLSGLIWMFTTQYRRALALTSHMRKEDTDKIKTEDDLRLAALMYQHGSQAMLVTNSKFAIVSVNPAFTELTGYSLEEFKDTAPQLYKSDRQDHAFFEVLWETVNATGQWQGEVWNRHKNGDINLASTSINTIYRANGTVHRYVALFSDITKKRQSEDLIWHQANYDQTTSLPNRHMFQDRLAQALKISDRSKLPVALLLLDLDNFKEVNDALGHAQGDVLLTEAARRICACVRKTDTVARLGGDEFTVILSEMGDAKVAERIAQNIIDSLAAPFDLQQEVIFVSASVGITLYPTDSQNIDALIKHADQAMYVAKNLGGNRFVYFTKSLQQAAESRLSMMRDLRKAVVARQLEVYYQPIIEMATGKICKAEALLRWRHPELGMVNPLQFIPLTEESGLIHELGDWVFHMAVHDLARWREQFNPEFQISVNVSPVQFRQNKANYMASWVSHLQAMKLPGQSLVIEITEGLLLNAEANVIEKINSFRNAGIKVAMDDFGTGYSSLAYLKKFDIDYLKIDQSFVCNLVQESSDKALCEAIIVMAHKLGLKVIAEGVETQAQRDQLLAYGCDYAQGWLYAKAMTAGDFEMLLAGVNGEQN